MVPDTCIIQNYQKRSCYLPLLRLKPISSFKTPRIWPWLEGQWNSIVSAVGVSGCAVLFWAKQDLSPSSGFHQFRQIIHSLLLCYSSIKLGSLFCSLALRTRKVFLNDYLFVGHSNPSINGGFFAVVLFNEHPTSQICLATVTNTKCVLIYSPTPSPKLNYGPHVLDLRVGKGMTYFKELHSSD